MTDRRSTGRLHRILPLLVIGTAITAYADDDFFTRPTWKPVPEEAVYDLLEQFLNTGELAPTQQAEIRDAWQSADKSADSEGLLDRLAAGLSQADPRIAELVTHCSSANHSGKLPEFAWLADSATPELVRHNMRLYWARWLIQQGYFDEGLSWTEGLSTDDVVAPEALLFYRAVAHHRLVQPDQADADLGRLLQREDDLPARFQKLADLMRQDLAALKDDSLDHIARRMADIRRRLVQGRSGERVQTVEDGVIESLDKLIKQAEDQLQQQQQQAQSSPSPGSQQGGTPMPDSQLGGQKAPGNVDRRDVGDGSGWGNLPERDREKALQDIGREFPSHYREVIEQYFRRLAAEESTEKP
jgi:hypothetical protein